MEAVTKYKANDGSLWDSESAATERDELIKEVNAAMAPLGERNEAMSDGKGWVQHQLETVLRAKDAIIGIVRARKVIPEDVLQGRAGRAIHPFSIVGRYLDDRGGPLNSAWSRFMSIDEMGREHQQPYFAKNGPDREHYCIETR
jgi:hypothetical protein